VAVDTGVIPPSLLNRPILQSFDVEVLNAFTRLSARRSVNGFGAVGAIPYVEISAYLDLVVTIEDPEDRALFIDLVEFLDSHFLKDYGEKRRAEEAKTKSKRPKV
jgi:hypothetical protein